MIDTEYHIPVLAKEVIDHLVTDLNGVYVDGTLGGGGHAELILSKLSENGKVLGFDVDPEAHEFSAQRLKPFGSRFIPVKMNFEKIKEGLIRNRLFKVNGIFLDLGVSSHQLDDPKRGFTFREETPIDLRLDPSLTQSANDILTHETQQELANIFYRFGEEKFSRQIASEIIKKRKEISSWTTKDLTNCIDTVIYGDKRNKSYARIFQALRIAVNQELSVLEHALKNSEEMLSVGGRLVIISYHSLEDRLVKDFFSEKEKQCICPARQPVCTCDKHQTLKIITKKPMTPTLEELHNNPRSRSAKMRIAEKVEPRKTVRVL